MKQEPVAFWWVWTKKGAMPKRFHDSAEAAEAEAQRLAALHPGTKFIVMKAYTKFSV